MHKRLSPPPHFTPSPFLLLYCVIAGAVSPAQCLYPFRKKIIGCHANTPILFSLGSPSQPFFFSTLFLVPLLLLYFPNVSLSLLSSRPKPTEQLHVNMNSPPKTLPLPQLNNQIIILTSTSHRRIALNGHKQGRKNIQFLLIIC